MRKIIPDYSYKIEIDGSQKELGVLKNKLVAFGATIESESAGKITLRASSNAFSKALYPFSSDLLINLLENSGKIVVEVIRRGERSAAIGFFAVVCVLSILICIQDKSIQPLIGPVVFFILAHIMSFLPTHPAHRKIRDLTRLLNE